jgi:hypothetical protein
MSEFIAWAQGNWYAVGTLLIEIAFFIAVVWFARNILRAARAFQEQVGALLKLSITAAPTEVRLAGTDAKRSLAEASPYWLTPSESPTVALPETTDSGPSRFVVAWRHVVLWLETPMGTSKAGRWRRVIHWLQAPAGN